MTIHSHINPRLANECLGHIESCRDHAPSGTHPDAAEICDLIGGVADEILERCLDIGLKAPGDDSLREVEAVIYNYISRHNPDRCAVAEGFGRAMETPRRDQIIAQTMRDRDFLRKMKSA